MLLYLAALVLTSCEVQTTRYETVAAARADQLFERGWVPDVFPASAGPVVETHDLDTNERCSRVSFPADSLPRVQALLQQKGFHRVDHRPARPPFDSCPFEMPDRQEAAVIYERVDSAGLPLGLSPEVEHVVLSRDGEFYFWSGERD